jgi:murein DD-endopeptidase MepM/ murein hydrolase activator NlpD
MRSPLCSLFCLAASLGAQTFTFTPAAPRQGQALKVRAATDAVEARLDHRTITLFPQTDGRSLGLMPIPVLQKPGAYKLEFLDKGGAVIHTSPLTILDAHYPRQNIVIAEAISQLKPSPGEQDTVRAFRTEVTPKRYWTEPLDLPVPGCMTSLFGVTRYHNGKPTGDYHAGIDQRAAAGSPIHAIAAGVVKIVQLYNLRGGTVAVDHGQGLESIYLHMSKFAVKEGDVVERGDVIGFVGATGRATGPHLHWTIYANGEAVNPLQWVHTVSCYSEKAPARKHKGPDVPPKQ